MNIYLNAATRLVKSDFNIVIQSYKKIEKKDKETGKIVEVAKDWVTVPNFFTSSIKRAIRKAIDLELYNFNFESFESYEKKTKKF